MEKKTALQTRSSLLFGKRGERWIGGESKERKWGRKKRKSAAANLKRKLLKRVSAENVREYGMEIQLHNKDSETSE